MIKKMMFLLDEIPMIRIGEAFYMVLSSPIAKEKKMSLSNKRNNMNVNLRRISPVTLAN